MYTLFVAAAVVTAAVAVISFLTVSIGSIIDWIEAKWAQCSFDRHTNQMFKMIDK